MTRAGIARDAPWIGVTVAAITLPFLGKAFHIDDPAVLAITTNVLSTPFDPYRAPCAPLLWAAILSRHLSRAGNSARTGQSRVAFRAPLRCAPRPLVTRGTRSSLRGPMLG